MRKFLKKFTILIILPFLFIFIIVETLLRHLPNDYYYKNKWLTKNASQIKTLSVGSSLTYFGINPEYLTKKSFNAAHVYQNTKYDLLILQKFMLNCDSLQYLVYPLSYHSFFYSLENSDQYWRIKNYYLFYGFKNQDFNIKYKFACFDNSLLSDIQRIYQYYLNDKSEIYCNELGFGKNYTLNKRAIKWEEEGIIKAKSHTELFDKVAFDENLKNLNKIVDLCNKKKIKLILLFTPAWHTYSENLNKSLINLTIDKCEEICRKNKNAIFINMLNDKRFIASDFYDVNHLNEFGSKKFTRIIDSLTY